MSYQLISFDGQDLPQAEIELKNTYEAQSAIYELPGGGIFDYYQDDVAPLKSRQIPLAGYLVAASHADLVSKIDALKRRVGKKAILKRKVNVPDVSRFSQTICDARLITLSEGPFQTLMQRHVPVSCVFAQLTEWRFRE